MTSSSKQLYLFANWKMYLDYNESNNLAIQLRDAYARGLSPSIHMAVFPSALSFVLVNDILGGSAPIFRGAQNICWVEKGAYTGEISAEMYRVGASYALIGHSERRHIFKETNHEVRLKIEAALAAGLEPVLCVGETLKEREEGKAEEVVEAQLRAAFHNLSWPDNMMRRVIIAYEPVWAVNTGNACDPQEAERMQSLIHGWVTALTANMKTYFNSKTAESIKSSFVVSITASPEEIEKAKNQFTPIVLYGGSVRKENAAAYFQEPHIDGVLVGQASTKLETWMEIVKAAEMVIGS